MALDLAVDNVGDYYSAHYLDSTLERDAQVKRHYDRWKELKSQGVPSRLLGLSDEYFKAKESAMQLESLAERLHANGLSSWHHDVCKALGYHDYSATTVTLSEGEYHLPLIALYKRSGEAWLAIAETPFCLPDTSLADGVPSEDPLECEVTGTQAAPLNWGKGLQLLFSEEDAPRWCLLLSGSTMALYDRNTFAQSRYLRFDLDDALSRKELAAAKAFALFLSYETLCPDAETTTVLHETIAQQSHKFAYGVSEALQYAVREAIEALANEWVADRRAKKLGMFKRQQHEIVPGGSDAITAEDLRHEALVYVYRLLFCFYAEARGGELGILPMSDPAYRQGYSLESLRDLEHVSLSATAAEGTYFQHHLSKLFSLIHKGYGDAGLGETSRAFVIAPLTATLFDPAITPLFSRARFRNICLQKVVRSLSLTTHEGSRSVGRVNYAELGINQLGAVYEGLLSYQGMLVEVGEDKIQVKPKGKDMADSKTQSWFVPASRLAEFHRDEVVRTPDDEPRVYKPGSFILHLNGIDREKSASYYTPEVLTRCLVQEALRELLQGYEPADAKKILDLKLCEPAMGSGAFLNEAASQLAHHYLELMQKNLGRRIEPGRYADEHRRVQHYIAVNNIYGVDLNPTAVELGALSLWLGSMHQLLVKDGEGQEPDSFKPGATPWFGLRLRAGNSLIGARLAVYTRAQVASGKHTGANAVAPRALHPGEKRKKNEIYHFLFFDEAMVPAARDAFVKERWGVECETVARWVREQVRPAYSDDAVLEVLLRISDTVDAALYAYWNQRDKALEDTKCTATVWPDESSSERALRPSPSLEEQERIKATLESNSGFFQRLKLLMDSWCALWFWPIEKAEELPNRSAWLAAAEVLLETKPSLQFEGYTQRLGKALRFDIAPLFTANQGTVPDTEALSATLPWYGTSKEIAEAQRFMHWELSFPEVLVFCKTAATSEGGQGFDLVVGNPPWIKATFGEMPILSELDPMLGVKEGKIGTFLKRKEELLAVDGNARFFGREVESASGMAAFLGSTTLYPALKGGQTNLYKNFIVRSWDWLGERGIGGLLHPEGVFDETKGERLREEYYPRLRGHYQFRNAIFLFKDVHDGVTFSINVFGSRDKDFEISCIFNLLHPNTLNQCGKSIGTITGIVPGLKSESGEWELRGHPDRVVEITGLTLKKFCALAGLPEKRSGAVPLPQIHSKQILDVVRKVCEGAVGIGDAGIPITVQRYYDESGGQRNGEITRQEDPSFIPQTADEVILTGPLFFVGNPFYKNSRTTCDSNQAFDPLDLTTLPPDFLPRTVYKPGDAKGNRTKFEQVRQQVGVTSALKQSIVGMYRIGYRRRSQPSSERSLLAALMPPGFSSINAVMFIAMENPRALVSVAGSLCSLVSDFLFRVKGRSDLYEKDVVSSPNISDPYQTPIITRTLRLQTLTTHYAPLYLQTAPPTISSDSFTSTNPMLTNPHEHPWSSLSPTAWNYHTPLRTDFARRQALLEIDVLVALSLNINLDELLTMYRVQFPVMRQYEREDEYDATGRRLPNTKRKTPGAKELRDARQQHGDQHPIHITWPTDGGTATEAQTFYPPFQRVDREDDYARAYQEFEKRLK
jgi:hypothetical protein